MTDANQNPPSEREWTIEEREEFFAGQDAVTGLFNGAVANSSVHCSAVRYFSIDDIERIFNSGIHVTKIVPPTQGWIMAFYCPLCKETVFVHDCWGKKPAKGDYFLLNEVCASEEFCWEHNMKMGMKGYHAPTDLKPGGLLWMSKEKPDDD